MPLTLRDYQHDAVSRVRSALRRNRRVVLQSPTGSGKTTIAADIVQKVCQSGNRALFLAPRRELIYQTSETLDRADVDHGIIMAKERGSMVADIQVACVPTLYARAIRTERMDLPHADLIIVDEAHLSITKMTRSILNQYPDAFVIGMTATPARSDGRGLDAVYDEIVPGESMSSLIEQGYLVPPRYFVPDLPDLNGVRVVRGDYDPKELAKRMNRPKLVGDVVYNYLRICPDRPAVVFAVNIAHSLALRDAFREAGISAEHIDGEMSLADREAVLTKVRNKECQVVCNCQILSYGWDQPHIACAIMAKPTKSRTAYIQSVGRVLRADEGKEDAIIIDHAGAVLELGFVEDPIEWSLSGKDIAQCAPLSRKEAEAKELICDECSTVFGGTRICPNCGHEHKRKPKHVIVRNGELSEYDKARGKTKRAPATRIEKELFYSEVLAYCKERGYKHGWAAHKFNRRFGHWPEGDYLVEEIEYSEIRPSTIRWITSELIRYVKGKQKSEIRHADRAG